MKDIKLNRTQKIIIALVFMLSLAGAYLIDESFCPDEYGRRLLSDWICQNGRLPLGDEPELIIGEWGFSYALRPYVSAIVGAVFTKLFSVLGFGGRMLLVASRMCSVISITSAAYFGLKLGNEVLDNKESSVLMTVVLVFNPQTLFLGMYQNNDILSIAAVMAVIYCIIKGNRDKWNIRSCIMLSISVSVCLLSYYTVYGWLLVLGIVFLFSLIRNSGDKASGIIKKILLIAALITVCAGWFFIRNAMIHNGDFLGVASEETSRNQLIAKGYNVIPYDRPCDNGVSFISFLTGNNFSWIHFTIRSTFAAFGYMNIWIAKWMYWIYYLLIIFYVALYLLFDLFGKRKQYHKMMDFIVILSGMITVGLSVYQSYFRDYQPQGRYIITVLISAGYMMGRGADRITDKTGKKWIANAGSVLWFCLSLSVFLLYMSKMFIQI